MKRASFLSNKLVNCDFCGSEFYGNINQENTVMCWKCVTWLCNCSDDKKLKFLERFKGYKEKEKLIKRFINEEVLYGREAKKHTEHIARETDNRALWFTNEEKLWKEQGDFILGNAWTE